MPLNSRICELIGIIIGDGNIWFKDSHYRIEITGNPKTDLVYFNYINNELLSDMGLRGTIKTRSKGLRLRICSKEFFIFLTKQLGMYFGRGKCFNVTIPKKALKLGWSKLKWVIRGIADTDGSLFVSDKRGSIRYPSIEITTVSKRLASQLNGLLEKHNYRVRLRSHIDKRTNTKIFKISVNGEYMVGKWINDIGFSNPTKKIKGL